MRMVVSENATWDLEMKKTSALVDGCTVPGHSISHVSSRLLKSDFSISTDANRTGKRRGVVHSQRGCADFKSLKKILCFIELFQIFRIFFPDFFWLYEDFMIKKIWGLFTPKLGIRIFNPQNYPWNFWNFFRIFGSFLGVCEDFFLSEQPLGKR